jgi:hypothetical protein
LNGKQASSRTDFALRAKFNDCICAAAGSMKRALVAFGFPRRRNGDYYEKCISQSSYYIYDGGAVICGVTYRRACGRYG